MQRARVLSAVLLCGVVTAVGAGCASTANGRATAATRPAVVATPSGRDMAVTFTEPPMPAPNEYRAANGAPGPGYWQQVADYVIEATLDAQKRVVTARGTVTYTNNSPDVLTHVWFNLEQNLFSANSEGTRLTKSGARFGNRDKFDGGFTIRSVSVSGDPLELEVHDTVARLDLPEPLAARGGRVAIDLAWSFPMPSYGSRRAASAAAI